MCRVGEPSVRQLLKSYIFSVHAAATVAFIFTFIIFQRSDIGNELRERAVAPLEFSVRLKLGRVSELSDNLKVLTYGDKAKVEFGEQEFISVRQWADFIFHIASREPRMIVFDKIFTSGLGGAADFDYFKKTLAQLSVPVVAAGLFIDSQKSVGSFSTDKLAAWSVQRSLKLPSGELTQFTGPSVSLRDSFSGYGGIQLNHSTSVYPAWLDSASHKVLPQLGLTPFKSVSLNSDEILLDGKKLFLDRFGRIPIDFVDMNKAYRDFLPMSSVLRRGANSPVISRIHKGDVVIVLPLMYTGSTDFKKSPVGRIPGGLYHVSVMNSAISGVSIQPILKSGLTNFVVFTLIALFVWIVSARYRFSVAVVGVVAFVFVCIAFGLFSFTYFGMQSDWHLYALFVGLYGASQLGARAIRDEKHAERVEFLLEGVVAKDVLKQLKYKPEVLQISPREQTMTVMFIDIEGFSLRTKDLLPFDMFSVLHSQIAHISEIVHENGGIVDRVLGDGLLCFFGFSFDQNRNAVRFDHAERALKCALAVQRAAVDLTSSGSGETKNLGTVLPLRVGLCSGHTYIGNLGTQRRLDFTVIGHTVNMAKRYEDACETFRVFMCESTYSSLLSSGALDRIAGVQFYKRFMSLKHHTKLVAGWECDPFHSDQNMYRLALARAQAVVDFEKASVSYRPKQMIRVVLNGEVKGHLVEIDDDQLVIEAQSYYCRKVFLVIELRSDSEDLNTQLVVSNLKNLQAQVVSGGVGNSGEFRHEMTLLHMSSEKRDVLRHLLLDSK